MKAFTTTNFPLIVLNTYHTFDLINPSLLPFQITCTYLLVTISNSYAKTDHKRFTASAITVPSYLVNLWKVEDNMSSDKLNNQFLRAKYTYKL
jgi:hypothetical protein